jgi:hemin uptake protein HemP
MATPDSRQRARADGAAADATSSRSHPQDNERVPRIVSSETLLAGASQLAILHNDAVYYLRQTRLGKLILTK